MMPRTEPKIVAKAARDREKMRSDNDSEMRMGRIESPMNDEAVAARAGGGCPHTERRYSRAIGLGDRDLRRGAGGLPGEQFRERKACLRFGEAGFDILRDDRCRPGLRAGPLRRGYGAPPVVITAAGIVDDALIRFRGSRTVALMSRHAKTAGMRRSSRDRQRERSEGSGKREQQEESGGQAMHRRVRWNPSVGPA